MTELTMPKLSDSMEQGTIITWLKAEGQQVQAGEDLVEIETDKATVTHPADAGGVLRILASEGTTLAVGEPIAQLGVADGASTAESAQADDTSDPVRPEADTNGRAGAGIASTLVAVTTPTGTSPRATPLARRVAKAHGISLTEVNGSGPLGRITRGDVLTKAGIALERAPAEHRARADDRAPAERRAPAAAATGVTTSPSEPPAASSKGTVDVIEPNRLQSVIARRMAEAKATVPHFQVQTEVVMDAAFAFRQQLKEAGGRAPSFNDLIVKAAALALRHHPLANGTYRDGRFELHSRVNVGIAVAAEHALVVPTIFDADQKSLGSLAAESRRLAERVRTGEVTPSELSGATFTVSNLGMYGMTAITPVINPPQAAILGVGAIRETLARADGDIVDRRLLTLTLSCDHRILYGADAAAFLSTIREQLEAPLRLV
jgi:pyruvate dehydrogenase E2 component (dihydrolipoamide acetyltransferase)